MKVVKIQAPDGTVVKVEGPDDATDQDFIEQGQLLYEQNLSTREAQKEQFPTPAEHGAKPGTATEAPPLIADVFKSYFRPVASTIGDLATGAGQEAAKTVMNLGKMSRRLPVVGPVIAAVNDRLPKIEVPGDILTAQNATQKVGGAIERISEFAAPGGLTGKLAAAGKLGVFGRGGLEAVSAYGVSTAHGDENDDAVRNALMSGGVTAAFGAALKGLGSLGKRAELAAVKPLKSTLEDVRGAPKGQEGKKLIDDIYKYKLGGSLDQTYTKAESLLDNLEQRLQSTLKANPRAHVDLKQALNDTALELGQPSKLAANMTKNKAIERALIHQLENVDLLDKAGVTSNGVANLSIANNIKRGLGRTGSWLHGFADPDNEANQIVATALYKNLRKHIETAAGHAGPTIKNLNQQMSEVLPIVDAMIKRIPVERRREIFSLKEFAGLALGDSKGLGFSVLDRILRSPRAANQMVKASQVGPRLAPRLGQAAAGVTASAAEDNGRTNPFR